MKPKVLSKEYTQRLNFYAKEETQKHARATMTFFRLVARGRQQEALLIERTELAQHLTAIKNEIEYLEQMFQGVRFHSTSPLNQYINEIRQLHRLQSSLLKGLDLDHIILVGKALLDDELDVSQHRKKIPDNEPLLKTKIQLRQLKHCHQLLRGALLHSFQNLEKGSPLTAKLARVAQLDKESATTKQALLIKYQAWLRPHRQTEGYQPLKP